MPETNNLRKTMDTLTDRLKSDSGRAGTIFITGASTSSGSYSKILLINDCVITSITASGITGSTDISSAAAYPAGAIFAGDIEKIILKTGSAMIYTRES